MASSRWFHYGSIGCLFLVMSVSADGAGLIQFGLAELPGTSNPHGDSFIVTIPESHESTLSHARALVEWVASGGDPADSPGATILVTQIAAGADGINRNFLADDEPLWSWHAVGAPLFADSTIEILDGWPTFVEQDVEGWIDNTNGQIGFWSYTVVAELGPVVPVPPLAGDYNNDGIVNAADYVLLRDGRGSRDFQMHYDIWKAHFGESAGSETALPSDGALSAEVPEPATILLTLLAAATLGLCSQCWEKLQTPTAQSIRLCASPPSSLLGQPGL